MLANRKKSFIVGATDLARLLYANLLEAGDDSVAAFAVHEKFLRSETLMGLPVLPLEKAPALLPPATHACHVCIGYTGMNGFRRAAFAQLKGMGYEILSWKHPAATVHARIVGKGNIFFRNVFIDHFTAIGEGNIFYPGSSVAHDSAIGDFNYFAVCACIAGHARLGSNNFIGANATVINDMAIGDFCLVGAGAILSRNLADSQVYVPARGQVLPGRKSTDFL